MIRFLRSINIENIDDFNDLSFDLCKKNQLTNRIDMQICKDNPWSYDLLKQFQDALFYISYDYDLKFSYRNRPNIDNLYDLFKDWYRSIYHVDYSYDIKKENSTLIFIFKDKKTADENNDFIEDFKEFLKFIGYYNFFEIKIKIIKAKVEEVEEIDFEQLQKEKEEKLNKAKEISQKQILKQEEEKAISNAKRKEAIRRNTKGNYNFVECIKDIDISSGNIEIIGKIFQCQSDRFDKNKHVIGIYDNNLDAIFVNFTKLKDIEDYQEAIDCNVLIRGCPFNDERNKSISIQGHEIELLEEDEVIKEESLDKRVELHLHTKMSTMDAVSTMEQYCKYASKLGMKAIAITDHGVIQGYPDAQKAGKKYNMKILYGAELYMVNDELEFIKNPANLKLISANYVVFDLETTGLSCRHNRITEFAGVRIEKGTIVSRFDILINPECDIPELITEKTRITNDMVKNQPTFKEAKEQIKDFIKDAILVSHNADFDIPFLNESLLREGDTVLENPVIDTLSLSRYLIPNSRNHRLGTLCSKFEVEYSTSSAHRADYDANVLAEVWLRMIPILTQKNPNMLHSDLAKLEISKEALKHIHPYHIVVLAKNYEGLHDLYRIISASHIDYLSSSGGSPRVPRNLLVKYHKNLLFGSACFNSEIFEIASHKSINALKEAVSFYDYIEVQPLRNYTYLVNNKDYGSLEEIKDILLDIINVADELNIKVCATGDVHYCYESEKEARDVYIASEAVGHMEHPLYLPPYQDKNSKLVVYENPSQNLLSTDDMLKEFEFLGKEKAYEIVVANTNFFANKCEDLIPIPNDKLYVPKIENSEQMLRDLCYGNAYKIYGNPLPEYIAERLEKELNGIINNGYSVIYYIAHLIVKKVYEDGYLVGSRGSVGSSFAATMANITEVNPLPPHYICPKCHHFEWTKDEYPNIVSGYDLPDKVCPKCGSKLIGDGQNIPFETFLGFNAEKTPDIDLNFPSDYQKRAFDYTKVLLGEDNVFRAGTIETVQDKTAFGYVKGYYEKRGIDPNSVSNAKINYLVSRCQDVKRTTGQHPGGIIVIPNTNSVYDFTPIQYPGNDPESDWKTTHFDFNSIHDTILKLDLLGHVDPLALKMMLELVDIDIKDIPMHDEKVLSLFSSVDALNLEDNKLNEATGALALPEFGTPFVRGILEETQPKSFSDLVIISGLSHGTGVYQDNAQTLINKKIATLQEVIGCRDDIMTYLVSKGIDAPVAFSIMEDVRKGRGIKEEFEIIMKKHNVPQYYIDSANAIKYMFPKGHATAYVMMAVRVGYFKVYYPLEFYAVYFSIRCKKWEISTMIKGKEAILNRYNELKMKSRSKTEKISDKEKEIMSTLEVAVEMSQRGYKFENISISKSQASTFVIDYQNKSLICPFSIIDNLGEDAALSVIKAREERPFSSIADLEKRSKLNSTNIKDLQNLHVFDDLSEDDQMSLFDFNY